MVGSPAPSSPVEECSIDDYIEHGGVTWKACRLNYVEAIEALKREHRSRYRSDPGRGQRMRAISDEVDRLLKEHTQLELLGTG